MIERLLESSALSENISDDELDESGDSMKVTSLTSISDFLNCAGITLPEISGCGREEILRLHVPTKLLLKKNAMLRELCQ